MSTPMDCQAFAQTLDDWLDGRLQGERLHAAEMHERRCPACAQSRRDALRLQQALRRLPAPPLPRAGFAAQALRRARLANPEPRTRAGSRDASFALAGALAAGLGMAAVLWMQPRAPASVQAVTLPAVQTVTLTAGEVESLRMRIDAPEDLHRVRFTVELPDQVWLAEQPGIRAITWDGSLVAGENLLELPLVAVAGAAGTITARVSWGDGEHRLETRVVSVAPGLSPESTAGGDT